MNTTMKTIFAFLGLLVSAPLLALQPVSYLETVSITTRITGAGTSLLTVNADSTVTLADSVSSGTHESDMVYAQLRPGKQYPVNFAGDGPAAYEISFTAPTGYAIYINNLPSDLYSRSGLSGSYSHDCTLEVRPIAGSNRAAWGSFSGISIGQAVSWEVGLGGLRTGRGAGVIVFKERDMSGNNAVRDRLYYTVPPNYLQVTVINDGPTNQRLRQVVVPSGILDLVDVTNGYELRFYTTAQASLTGGLYTFSGSPWKTISVLSTTAGSMEITETEGATTRVSDFSETGFVSSSVGSGGTVSTSGGGAYSIHTFTDSGSFTLSAETVVDYLVVGGGGGGGDAVVQHFSGGGGGGGSVQYLTSQTLAADTYTVSVGAGGAHGQNGSNSVFNGTTAYGGGHGQSSNAAPTPGGSGGGGGANAAGASAGSGSNVYGGGTGDNGAHAWQGGGGGGAGEAGHGVSQGNFNGGNGISNSISGTATYYGGGGGGGTANIYNPTTGGAGGGGGNPDGKAGTDGTANTGGGGGGAGYDNLSGIPWNGGAGGSGVVIIRYAGGQAGNFERILKEGDGSTWERTTEQVSAVVGGQRQVVQSVYHGDSTSAGDLITRTKYLFDDKTWGEELDQVIADPDGAALTTTYTYYETAPTSGSSTNRGNYRRVRSILEPTGNWVAYEFHDEYERRGQLLREYHPYLDSPATVTLDPDLGRVVEFTYTYDWTGRYREVYTRKEKVGGALVAQMVRDQDYDSSTTLPRRRYNESNYSNSTDFLLSHFEHYRADADTNYAGLPVLVTKPNGQRHVYFYAAGFYSPETTGFSINGNGSDWMEWHFAGTGTTSFGGEEVSTYDGRTFDPVWLIPYKSTREVTIRSAWGAIYRTETWVYTGSGAFSLMSFEDFTYDAQHRLTEREASNGATVTNTFANGRLASTIDAAGIETQFTSYDGLGRVLTSVKKGDSTSVDYAAQGDITTTYSYDTTATGLFVKTEVTASGEPSQASTVTYDHAGRLAQQVSNATASDTSKRYTTAYTYASGGRIITVTLPGGADKVTEVYPDGQMMNVTGSAVVHEFSSYSLVNSGGNGSITRRVRSGADTTSAPFVETTIDWLGRAVSEVRPSWSGNVTRTWTYNSNGLLAKTVQPGVAPTLYFYNSMGDLWRTGLDIGGTADVLDDSSSDRITDHAWTFFLSGSNWWRRATSNTLTTVNSSLSKEVSKVETQLSGFTTNQHAFTKSYDVFGNVTTTSVVVDRTNKLVTTTTVTPLTTDGDAVQIAYNGLVVETTDPTGLNFETEYDGLGRPVASIDPRIGTTTTAYISGTSQISTITDPANIVQATYAYDSAGRVSSIKNADDNYVRYGYNSRGQKTHEWGEANYPIAYVYDDWGRIYQQKTYKDATDTDEEDWGDITLGTAAVTTWHYQEATGFLESKEDAANEEVEFTYTQAGQIATRTLARGVTTTYGYSATTGELLTQTYSDGTPPVTYEYNRLGQLATVVDATADSTNKRIFNYNLSGTLELETEVLGSAFYGDRRITYGYDSATGVVGRASAFMLGHSTDDEAYQSVAYGYQSNGRLSTVAGGGRTFTYGYTTDSHLIASVTSGDYADVRTYGDKHDWTKTRVTAWGTGTPTIIASFDYDLDNTNPADDGRDKLGRVKHVIKEGAMFDLYESAGLGLETHYAYDARSQVIDEKTIIADGSNTVLTGRNSTPGSGNHGYTYDQMGNRTAVIHNGRSTTYTPDNLNRYSSRTSSDGVVEISGITGDTDTVWTNGYAPARHHKYFFKDFPLANTDTLLATTLTGIETTTKSVRTKTPVNYNGQTVTQPSVTGPDDSSHTVYQLNGLPYHVYLNKSSHGYNFQTGRTYMFGFWARTVSGTRSIKPALTRDVNTDKTHQTHAIGPDWKWVSVTKTYSGTMGTNPRCYFTDDGGGATSEKVPFQVYGAVIVDITDAGTYATGNAFIPEAPEAFTYDLDGNLTRDGRWVYEYDAENRLVTMYTRGAPEDPNDTVQANIDVWNSGILRQKLVFVYDYLGRRVQKTSYVWDSSDWETDPIDTKYVYNGWNLIAELNATSLALVRTYTWGLDLSGSIQGAGGVGGLLMIQDDGDTFLPAYDAMGNLHALMTASAATIDGTSYSAGDIVAAYEYDAFGRTIRESEAYAAYNPFRFSTKYTDVETSLVYYGHRYYSPDLGRFINRDPIEEQGGVNLYSFVRNNAVNAWDYLGLSGGIPPDGVYNTTGHWIDGDDLGQMIDASRAYALIAIGVQIGSAPRGTTFKESEDAVAQDYAVAAAFAALDGVKKRLDNGETVKVMDKNGKVHELNANTTNYNISYGGKLLAYNRVVAPNSTGAVSGASAGTATGYGDPNSTYSKGGLTFTTTLTAQHIPGSQATPRPFGRGPAEPMGRDVAGRFIAGDVIVTITGSSRATPGSISFTVTDLTVTFPTTVYYNSTHWTYSNGAAALDTQYAENQHAIDFWTARDSIVIPALTERLERPFQGLPRDAERQLHDMILRTLLNTNEETRQRYDLPVGSAPHNGGSNPVPNGYPGFP